MNQGRILVFKVEFHRYLTEFLGIVRYCQTGGLKHPLGFFNPGRPVDFRQDFDLRPFSIVIH